MIMNKLSVVISAFNEEKKIEDCLKSVSDLADEIIFVDNTSTDKTLDIAKKYSPKVFTRKNNLMLNINKNFGFTKATGEWILNLDADERVTPKLAKEIKGAIIDTSGDSSQAAPQNDNVINGYWIPRKNIIFGKWIRSEMWWPDYQLRLFRKDKGKFPEKHVHEKIKVEGETSKLSHPLIHENYTSVSQFLYKMDKIYTENEVKRIKSSGVNLEWIDAIRLPLNDFLKTFFAQKGYKDGLHGLVLSLLQAFYAEIIFVKIWEKNGFKEENPVNFLFLLQKEVKKLQKEFKYWLLTSAITESRDPLKKLFYRITRKFFI